MCAHWRAIHIYPGLARLCLATPEKPCLNLPADDAEKVSATRYIDYVVGRERERERERIYVGVNPSNAGRAKHVGIEQQNSSRCAGIYAEICEYITHPLPPPYRSRIIAEFSATAWSEALLRENPRELDSD